MRIGRPSSASSSPTPRCPGAIVEASCPRRGPAGAEDRVRRVAGVAAQREPEPEQVTQRRRDDVGGGLLRRGAHDHPGRAAARDQIPEQLGDRGALLAVLGQQVEGQLVTRHARATAVRRRGRSCAPRWRAGRGSAGPSQRAARASSSIASADVGAGEALRARRPGRELDQLAVQQPQPHRRVKRRRRDQQRERGRLAGARLAAQEHVALHQLDRNAPGRARRRPPAPAPTATSARASACGHGTELVPASGSRRTKVTVPRDASAGSRVTRSSRTRIEAAKPLTARLQVLDRRRPTRPGSRPPHPPAPRRSRPERDGRQAGVDPPAPEPTPQPPHPQRPHQQPARRRQTPAPRSPPTPPARPPAARRARPASTRHTSSPSASSASSTRQRHSAPSTPAASSGQPCAGARRGERIAVTPRAPARALRARRRTVHARRARPVTQPPQLALLRRRRASPRPPGPPAPGPARPARPRPRRDGGGRHARGRADRRSPSRRATPARPVGPTTAAAAGTDCVVSASRSARSAAAISAAASRSSASGAP